MSHVTLSMEDLCDLALKLGADQAKVIKAEDVEVAEWVRLKCQYSRRGGSSLTTSTRS